MSETGIQENFITVAVVDDDAHVRTGLWWLLNNVVGMRCAGAYSSFSEAMVALVEQPPDVILLDVSMPDISGIDAIRPLRAHFPMAKIIMHSNTQERFSHPGKFFLKKFSCNPPDFLRVPSMKNIDIARLRGYILRPFI